MSRIVAKPLTRENFAPFGDVIDMGGDNRYPINAGRAMRYHDLATAEATGPNARVLISMVRGTPYEMPLKLAMVERHPLGSQAFIPLSPRPFLVVVCHDTKDGPGEPHAFLAGPGQGINYRRNLWHGVLTPIGEEQDFLIVDRGGDGSNLEEFYFSHPYEIHLP
ncbi:ureidoglycolate lyase [Mesorhizobium sp. M2C.T.Ca.TU.002.02.1.1]|uniref:ureidoglycolate lyase n=1 Tax=Mesorhizobium sp. M2C.T.Ca.TU.002.02.1.1 TaxID=2496788 RepID=UPI000FC9D49E|nr:ureidoglycolate lyase [Mesorhizobium sp. M2C.T.Ca.TU.002.02.1.1]RUU58480.1 ureidoglycolate lyase [Mesorhizobium sp. M2C.T.Ca.TU.002.02.1.1]RUU61396.1 ureidoglycolate lyase [Mesorhizobium sp. M2C.T.Ca.TU.009.01.2.1]